jgi:hypothetical protein
LYNIKKPGVGTEGAENLLCILEVSGLNFGSEAGPPALLSGLMVFLSNYSQIQEQKLVHPPCYNRFYRAFHITILLSAFHMIFQTGKLAIGTQCLGFCPEVPC